jgi:hypothetical protein
MITLLVETESGVIDHAKLRSIASIELAAGYVHIERWAILRVDPYDPLEHDQTKYDGYEFPDFYNEERRS